MMKILGSNADFPGFSEYKQMKPSADIPQNLLYGTIYRVEMC
jgi:hypothetical protein